MTLKRDSPEILGSLLLLDIKLPFHSSALAHCLTAYPKEIPSSAVLHNPPVSKKEFDSAKEKGGGKKSLQLSGRQKLHYLILQTPSGLAFLFSFLFFGCCFLWQQDETETLLNTWGEKEFAS